MKNENNGPTVGDLRLWLCNTAMELEGFLDEPVIVTHPIYPELVSLRQHHDRLAAELAVIGEPNN